jgi:hypothetical protein
MLVILAKARIQLSRDELDARLRGHDRISLRSGFAVAQAAFGGSGGLPLSSS